MRATRGAGRGRRVSVNASEPPSEASRKKPAIRQPVATWDMARYRKAARRACACSCSVATRAAVASVISSQASRNPIASPATKTISSEPSSTL